MVAELAGWRKFAQLVADHVFSDKHRHVDFAVVYRKGTANEFRCDGAGPGPGLDNGAVLRPQCGCLFGELGVDVGAFLKRTTHSIYLLPLRRMTALNNVLRGGLAGARLITQGLLTPRRTRRLSHTVTATVTTTV